MPADGSLQHDHILTFIGLTGDTGTPASKFTCSVSDCPYNPNTSNVDASQAMQIQESIAKRMAGLIRGNSACTTGACALCGEEGGTVPSDHLATCPYRLAALYASGALVDTAGSSNSGLVDDSTSQ